MHLARGALALAVVPLALTACGSSTSSAGPASTSTATSSAATGTASTAVVQTASATVAGAPTVVLTTSAGLTLYYRTTDTATSVTCTGACAASWPPLLASGTPTGSAQVTGTLTVFAGPLGSQVLYNGHPLYTWAKDTAPGMATGQGIGGFKVATPSLAP